jgi:hypothetical protein
LTSGQTGQLHFTYRYAYSPQSYQSSNTNAISDTFTINNDQTWAGGPNDDQYYTFGLFIGPTIGSLTSAIPVNLNLTLSYTSGTPSVNFTASYNGVIQNTFGIFIVVGDIYKREIIISSGSSSDGDSTSSSGTINYNLYDITAGTSSAYAFSFPAGYKFIQAYSGTEWWTFSTFPFNLEYNISTTDFAYSLDSGNTYYKIQGSDINIKTDGRYPKSAYPTQNYNLITPGQLPVIGGR